MVRRPKAKTVNLVLRLPPELHGKMVAMAAEDHRSLNAEIVMHLLAAAHEDDVCASGYLRALATRRKNSRRWKTKYECCEMPTGGCERSWDGPSEHRRCQAHRHSRQASVPLDDVVRAIHKKFAEAIDLNIKASKARLVAGVMLLDLRKRIDSGEAGDVSWWAWYEQKFVRTRKDAEKPMKLAAAEDPELAFEEERDRFVSP